MTHRLEQLLAACWLSFVGLLVAAKLAARAVDGATGVRR